MLILVPGTRISATAAAVNYGTGLTSSVWECNLSPLTPLASGLLMVPFCVWDMIWCLGWIEELAACWCQALDIYDNVECTYSIGV